MRITISKSKNAESFYITKSFRNNRGRTTSVIVRKLGTLKDLLVEHGPTRNDVLKWAKEEALIETLKYKEDQEAEKIQITFNANRKINNNEQVFFKGGYLFLQSLYYKLGIDKIFHKLRGKDNFEYDINEIFSNLVCAKILEPSSQSSSYKTALEFLEKPSYKINDVCKAIEVLGENFDFIQSEIYKGCYFLGERNNQVLYYDCNNYFFEIGKEDENQRYEKYKSLIIQIGMFMDGDGIPLFLSQGNFNEQICFTPLEEKILREFNCKKFIYCSDVGKGKCFDVDKMATDFLFDRFYTGVTNLLGNDVNILKNSESRLKNEEFFRNMKVDFRICFEYLSEVIIIKAHFLTCFLALIVCRQMEKDLNYRFTCEEILKKLRIMNFVSVQGQGYIPIYVRDELTDALHEKYGFNTDYEIFTKSQLKNIKKKILKNRVKEL